MNRETAARLLEKSLKDIFAFSVSRLYNKQDAEDLTNDIVTEVLSSVGRLECDSAFYGFMWKIAENTLKRYIRGKNTENTEFNENFFGVYWETPESKYIESEEVCALRRELALLSRQYRETTVKYYLENKTVSQISKELGTSEEMVKYYLFKTRKILKEGVNMERKFGERSYNPAVFCPDFWGNGSNGYIWQTFERKLPGNIVLSAYDKPMSLKDLSLELGVSAVYLEDELEILLKNNFIKKIGNKYQTDFLIFKTDYEREFQRRVPSEEICGKTTDKLSEITEKLLPEYSKKDFGTGLDDNALRWFIVNFTLLSALGFFEERAQEKLGEYPYLNPYTRGFVYGHDNNYEFGYFGGIYGHCENRKNTAWYAAVNYNIIKNCQWWQGASAERTEVLCDAILGKSVEDSNKETAAQLASNGMLTIDLGKFKPLFPVFTTKDFYNMTKDLMPAIELIEDCMDKICKTAAEIFKKYTPENLRDRCEQLCYVRHQADAMGIITEKLVEKGYLHIPDKKTNLCIFGVRRISEKQP